MYELLRAQSAVEQLLRRELPRDWPVDRLQAVQGVGEKVAGLTSEADILAGIKRSTVIGALPVPGTVRLVEKWVTS